MSIRKEIGFIKRIAALLDTAKTPAKLGELVKAGEAVEAKLVELKKERKSLDVSKKREEELDARDKELKDAFGILIEAEKAIAAMKQEAEDKLVEANDIKLAAEIGVNAVKEDSEELAKKLIRVDKLIAKNEALSEKLETELATNVELNIDLKKKIGKLNDIVG